MKLSPVILFTYNRPLHTKKTLLSISENAEAKETLLYIFIDGPKNDLDRNRVIEVKNYVNSLEVKSFFKEIIITESKSNKGLANSIINGVTKVFEKHETVIILEDDLIVSKDFLAYMNLALHFYKNIDSIGSVTAYNPLKRMPKNYNNDVFVTPRSCSYGWGTWKSIWHSIDWDIKDYNNFKTNISERRRFNKTGMDRAVRLDQQMQKNANSWSIRFGYNLFKKGNLTIYPKSSRISNIGWDESGTHSSFNTSKFNRSLNFNNQKIEFTEVALNEEIIRMFKKLYGSGIKQEMKEFFIIFRNIFK